VKTTDRATARELQALRWAVREAESWRGALVGNPDPGPLLAFEASIADAKSGLRKLIVLQKSLREAK
jgi:hypothetical protein